MTRRTGYNASRWHRDLEANRAKGRERSAANRERHKPRKVAYERENADAIKAARALGVPIATARRLLAEIPARPSAQPQ